MSDSGVTGVPSDDLGHLRQWRSGVVQEVSPPGVHDLGPGYLEPGLLPVGLLRYAYDRALTEYGAAALSYGHNPGVSLLRESLAARAGASRCEAANVVLTSGTSQALYLVSTALAKAGNVVLVEDTSYDLGRRIFTDCGLSVHRVPCDEDGMDPHALEAALAQHAGKVAFIYLIPTFHNPTGRVVPISRRHELLDAASRYGVLVVEDDAYADLAFDPGAVPPSLADIAGHRGVLRLCSFAKTLGPGLRLGWMLTDPELARRLVSHGLFVSGGSLNHTTSLAVAILLRGGDYDRHLTRLRGRLHERCDALAGRLRASLPDDVEIARPRGGFFLWLSHRNGWSEAELLATADRAGVRVGAGSRFGTTPWPSVRLAYSFNPPSVLAAAAQRLAGAWNRRPLITLESDRALHRS
ncbi:aminotransferase class I/II-fold pyridoxal phosphate-dependent enzyme [Sphaerisporangium sp. NPDC051017]|uniref:aminotransferase class I/II-fold pyridoxal phosphate-dependent enzyme n=1 Tax=Sphaerisporangium sp. NPDC051017 TaxID=3154636 RepID=UPI00341608DF